MKWPSLNTQILAGALSGLGLGLIFSHVGQHNSGVAIGLYLSGLVGGVFIDLLKMVLMPLVFTSIVVGIANLRAHRQIHRVWLTTLAFSLLTTSLSVVIGLSATHIFEPGKGLNLESFQGAMQGFQAMQLTLPEFFAKFLHGIFMNPVAALAQGSVLAIVVFALFVGIALVVGGERYRNLLAIFQELFELTMLIVSWIMRLAPFGIMALLAKLIATESFAVLGSLAKFVAVVMGTTLFHGIVVLPLILFLLTRTSPLTFFRGARQALITAFATSSSSATMPVTMRCLEHELGVSSSIAGFVVPLGAHLNMDGTALYEAAAALFVANLVGIDLNLTQQLVVCFTAMLSSIGAPGIPSAGMVTMIMVLQSVGLPIEAIAILLPIDRLLDTLRTAVNVEGDMVGSMVVQKFSIRQ
ncbi:MAG TPA: dicarboxylate/amino acid:cation symporter [Methylophilaceae bacterium]|jgi:Na+/H+-dicarboxylate symporter